jgi:hypothetical protein
MGVFWSTEWDVSEGEFSARVVARDRFELLRLNTFLDDEILESVTLKEIAEHVLNHAKVNIPLNDLEWEIDSSLNYFDVDYTWFGKVTYFEAIKQIAAACMGRAYCNRSGKIVIESYLSDSYSGSSDFSITADEYFKQSRSMQSVKNYVIVPVCPLIPEESTGTIYESDIVSVGALETTVTETVTWGDDAVLDHAVEITEQTGISVVATSETYTPLSAVIIFTKQSGTSGTFKYRVTGKRLVPETGVEDQVAYNDESIRLLNKQEHEVSENYLVQSPGVAGVIATAMLTSLLEPWRDVKVEVPGNPCTEIGDIANIEVYSKLSVSHEFRVIRQHFVASPEGLRCMITGKKTMAYGD